MLCHVPIRIDIFGVSMSDIKLASYSAAPSKFYPVLLCFFVGSGLAALIYEIVWFQLLEFIIGSTAAYVSCNAALGSDEVRLAWGALAGRWRRSSLRREKRR